MGAAKSLDMHDILPLREMGIKNFAVTPQRGLGMQLARHTVAAGPDLSLTFEELGFEAMANDQYMVLVENVTTGVIENVAARTETTITVAAGPLATDVLNILVIGAIAGYPAP